MADDLIAAIRRFNRFYTRQIGLLNEGLLETPFSLTEARVLYELSHGHALTASGLAGSLGLDAGYLSRMLRGFERRGLIRRERSARDRRESHIRLAPKGRAAFAGLNKRQQRQVAAMVSGLPPADRHSLASAMAAIERAFAPTVETPRRWARSSCIS